MIDASTLVAGLTSLGTRGSWAVSVMQQPSLIAPAHLPVETSHALRRLVMAGDLSAHRASDAHRRMQGVPISLLPYFPVAARVWQLRHNLTTYDAWYVSVAEAAGAPLATLDTRLANAPGPTCAFLVPDTP